MWKPLEAGLGMDASGASDDTCPCSQSRPPGRAGVAAVRDPARRLSGVRARCRAPRVRLLLYGMSARRPTMSVGLQPVPREGSHMSGTIHDTARASRRRPRAALAAAALCATPAPPLFSARAPPATLLFSAGAAPASVTTGPVDAGSGFPFSYADDVGKFALEQCQDNSG